MKDKNFVLFALRFSKYLNSLFNFEFFSPISPPSSYNFKTSGVSSINSLQKSKYNNTYFSID